VGERSEFDDVLRGCGEEGGKVATTKCIGGKSCLAGVRARFESEENGDETPNATTNDKDRVRFSPDHN